MSRKHRPSTDDDSCFGTLLPARNAFAALEDYLNLFEADAPAKYGLDLDTADPLVLEVEEFVKAYRKLYGGPVR